MKRIIKKTDSEILKQKLQSPKDNSKIREILEIEQDGFCAYTEYRLSAGFARDVEHFNPTLKNTQKDNYNNWFAVSHKWNLKKSDAKRWEKFQPVLHPTSEDFEDRVIFDTETASYIYDNDDIEAKNLIDLLDLNNENIIFDRLNRVILLKDLFNESNKNSFSDCVKHPKSKQNLIEFPRAIETVFNI